MNGAALGLPLGLDAVQTEPRSLSSIQQFFCRWRHWGEQGSSDVLRGGTCWAIPVFRLALLFLYVD